MPDADPIVSILMPARDRAALLPRAIRSVLNQTYARWELLVVDDGSADDTERVVRRLRAGEERIRFIRQEPSGPAAARNAGLAQAIGSYIACLDSDDEYLPEHLDLRVRRMREHPETILLHGGAVVIGPPEAHFVPDARDRTKRIPIEECIVGGTFFLLRRALQEVGGWRSMYAEDLDLFNRIAARYPTERVDFRTYVYHRDAPDSRCDAHALEQ